MVMIQTQPYARHFTRAAHGSTGSQTTPGEVIPYDYAAKFPLRGKPGNIVEDVINISSDGVFVATAIGYGLEEERGQRLEFARSDSSLSSRLTLGEMPV